MNAASPKKPGKTETQLSMGFMVILVIVGTGVLMRQFQINPAVIALRPDSRQQDWVIGSDKSELIDVTDSGITPFSSPQRFTPETLYEKINGRADLYLSSGFVTLETQRFSTDQTGGNWVELFAYDMTTPENAFSVFSVQRRQSAQPDDIVPHAYRTENALFMTHASYYLELIGTDASPQLQAAMRKLAGKFIQAHGGNEVATAPGADLFPQDGVEPDSLQLIAANAFGFELLDQVYACEYILDGIRLTAFVSPRTDARAASKLASDYRQTLLSYGATVADSPVTLDSATVMQFFDTYEIVFSRGRYLAGIHEADSLEAASTQAQRLFDHLGTSDGKL